MATRGNATATSSAAMSPRARYRSGWQARRTAGNRSAALQPGSVRRGRAGALRYEKEESGRRGHDFAGDSARRAAGGGGARLGAASRRDARRLGAGEADRYAGVRAVGLPALDQAVR